MGFDASVLARPRLVAFVVLGAAVGTWFVVAPHLSPLRLWPAVIVVAAAVLPGTLALVLVTVPLWTRRWLLPAAVVLVLVAWGCEVENWGLAANFAKLWAAVFGGWWFLRLFEELSWVVVVAAIIPFVDAISVAWGPTHAITSNPKHFHIYTGVAVAFLVPGGGAAYLGPPDILFYALFLAAALRWRLRPVWTWAAMTAMYSLTIVVANAAEVDGLPALPFLSFGFLVANGDLLWRRLRPAKTAP